MTLLRRIVAKLFGRKRKSAKGDDASIYPMF